MQSSASPEASRPLRAGPGRRALTYAVMPPSSRWNHAMSLRSLETHEPAAGRVVTGRAIGPARVAARRSAA